MVNKESPKYLEARNSLPDSLRGIFDELVDDYAFSATVHHGSRYVSYRVLADLVKNRWRLSGKEKTDTSVDQND